MIPCTVTSLHGHTLAHHGRETAARILRQWRRARFAYILASGPAGRVYGHMVTGLQLSVPASSKGRAG